MSDKLIILYYGKFADGKGTNAYQVARYDESDSAYHIETTTMTLTEARSHIEAEEAQTNVKSIEG